MLRGHLYIPIVFEDKIQIELNSLPQYFSYFLIVIANDTQHFILSLWDDNKSQLRSPSILFMLLGF